MQTEHSKNESKFFDNFSALFKT